MACTPTITACITQGDDWYLDVTFTDDGVFDDVTQDPVNPKNLTGASIVLTLKVDKDGAPVVAPTVSITDAELGRVRFSLTDVQTEALITTEDSRVLTGQCQITFNDGTVQSMFILIATIHRSWN